MFDDDGLDCAFNEYGFNEYGAMTTHEEHAAMEIDESVLARARLLAVADLHEAAGARGDLPWWIKPLDSSMKVCGRAFPVRCTPGDNLALHHAIRAAKPGDVLVVEAGARAAFGYFGDIMGTAAQARQLGGLVITGGVRDSQQLIAMNFPVFSGCISVKGTVKSPAGMSAVNVPVQIGQIEISAGDLVLGDADGVVAFPKAGAADIVARAELRVNKEMDIRARLLAGESTVEIYGLPALTAPTDGPSRSLRQSVHVHGLSHGELPIPAASRVANVVATGGVRGVDPKTGIMPEDAGEQAELMFRNVRQIVEAAGARVDDIVKMTIWIASPSVRTAINVPWIALFPDADSRPARHIMNYELPAGMHIQCEALAIVQHGP